MNRYPLWKYLVILVVTLIGLLYALPNLFGEAPAVQVSSAKVTLKLDASLAPRVEKILADAGIQLLGQSVLLKGVNADIDTLAELMCALVESRVRPYYLHHPDLAPGTSHFRVPIDEGQRLVTGLRGRISGLAQPTYVLDIPGGHGKAMRKCLNWL